jgi:DNA-binding response OmpR family regulator
LNVEVLVKSGYEVDAVENGAIAWYNLQLKRYDLLITDHDMPHVTGFELLRKLRAARMPVPVILATEKLPRDEFVYFPMLQPAITLLHPYTTEEFLQTVEGVLQAVDKASVAKARQTNRRRQSKADGRTL